MQRFDEKGVPTIRASIPMSLFGLGLFVALLFRPFGVASYIIAAIRGVDETGEAFPADWRLMVAVVGGLLILETALLMVTAWFYFQRHRVARPLVVIALVVVIATTVIEVAWSVALAEGDAEFIAQVVAPAVPACFFGVLWILYFLLSKQVRATLVYPLAEE
jgi:hypothetical protein